MCHDLNILNTIKGHEDLQNLSKEEQVELCKEIRTFLVQNVSKTGGHLASNLGVVELSVALETVFDTNKDRLVFDVGHQSYIHKLLTGRQADFEHLRQFGGIAGFPKPSESVTDAFVAGHASSSVSIALGMARARSLLGEKYNVIAVTGDGAATGGMIYEGLNDAAYSQEPMIIILNDNNMSIDRNVGGVARHLSKIRMKERYLGMKRKYRDFMKKIPGGTHLYDFTSRVKRRIRQVLLPTTIFENMGFTYLGPVDGHDLSELIRLLKVARDMSRPVVLHVLTLKGKGYLPAVENPSKFHGIGKFDPETGKTLAASGESFSSTFGNTLVRIADTDKRVCAITAAMPSGTGLINFKKKYPARLFDVGIAEEHAVSMAGGLAKQGMVPVVALYSTFLQRSYDQIMQDVAMLHLHVVLAVDRAGLVGEDGETHHGVFDVGFLRQAPGMMILNPASCAELSDMLYWAVEQYDGPVAVRYPRGGNRGYDESAWRDFTNVSARGALCCHREGADVAIITYGTLVNNVLGAADLLEESGIHTSVLRMMTVAPLPVDAIVKAIGDCRKVLIVEEACTGSGIHEALAWQLKPRLPHCKIRAIDLGDRFVTHGSTAKLYESHGLDEKSIATFVMEVLKGEN